MHHRPFWPLKDLERPGEVFRELGPNWFAAVMGTGIVASAAAQLPVRVRGPHTAALVVWVLAATSLVALAAAWAVHWTRHPDRGRAHLRNPVMAQFWGGPAMALLTVGAGTLLLGKDLMTRHELRADSAFGGWLMPVVPPMVSASTGAALIAHLWLCLAAAVTVRTVRRGMPFGLTWWAFTFPVGTCVTGTISLAARTHSVVLHGASIGLFAPAQ